MAKKKAKKKAAKKPEKNKEEKKDESNKIFDEADTNGNGHLSKEELHNAVANNTVTLPESAVEVITEKEAETIQPEPEEKPEIKEKPKKKDRPKGAPEACDCIHEGETATHYIYKIKHEDVGKYGGKKKIIIEK